MIVLLDTSEDLKVCSEELGCEVGQLLTPLTRFTLRDCRYWAIDNGAYSRFHQDAFTALLKREEHHKEHCLFVAVPDVVGSARRTQEIFYRWMEKLPGWKLALVCQDGQEDLPMPWDQVSAIFIGGSTGFKVSAGAEQLIKCAQILGKWVHVGRVNNAARFEHFEELGVDSVDGSGISQYSHMREGIRNRDDQGKIFA